MSLNKKFDFIIVGQGLAGTLLAHDLIEENKSVLLIDSNLKASASRVAAGLINPISMKRCIEAMPSYYLTKCLDRFLDLEKKLDSSFLKLKPILRLFDSIETNNQWKDKYKNEGMRIYIKELLSKNSFSSLNDSFSSALVEPAGHLDVIIFLDVSRSYFSKFHSLLNEKFDFSLFSDSEISYKNYTADAIIFCEGFRVKDNPYFNYLPIAPTKGEVMTIKIPSLEYFDKVISKGVYIIPLGNYLYTVGATYNRTDFTDKLTKEGQDFLNKRIKDILNVDYEVINSVAGVRPTVKDRKPLIGLHPKNPKIGIFNGLGARGVLMGPYLSKQFSSILNSNSNQNLDFETIDRFL